MRSSSSQTGVVAAAPVTAPPRRVRRGLWTRLPVWLRYGLLLAALIGIWQLYISLRDVNPLQFASPGDVARTFFDGWKDGTLASTTLTTLRILGLGMGFGILAAALLTAFATVSKIGDDLLSLLTAIINPLPGVAILPLAILWFGLSDRALVFVIANAVTWPIAISLSTGFKTVNSTIIAVARNIGVSGRRLMTDVLAPAALPHVISGLRTAWAFGWRTIIAAELVFGVAGGEGGLGNFINNARYFLDTPGVFAGLVTIALIGIALDIVFALVERRTVIRWGMKASDESGGRARLVTG